ncbi:MAG: hypothetical protein QXN55_04965 [Candidatus Nitrosotenuis sp.]
MKFRVMKTTNMEVFTIHMCGLVLLANPFYCSMPQLCGFGAIDDYICFDADLLMTPL